MVAWELRDFPEAPSAFPLLVALYLYVGNCAESQRVAYYRVLWG